MAGMMSANFRKIRPSDNVVMASLIRTVMPEFGANGPGFAIHDAEVDDLYGAYSKPGASYLVCEWNGVIAGGGGVAPLEGGSPEICELKKMYFFKDTRGKGFGRHLLRLCLEEARRLGYEKCYIETFHTMVAAIALYEKFGFVRIPSSLGRTGHFGCDRFYLLDLTSERTGSPL